MLCAPVLAATPGMRHDGATGHCRWTCVGPIGVYGRAYPWSHLIWLVVKLYVAEPAAPLGVRLYVIKMAYPPLCRCLDHS
jgi:hypothetical protein